MRLQVKNMYFLLALPVTVTWGEKVHKKIKNLLEDD